MRRFLGEYRDGNFVFTPLTLKHMKVVRLEVGEEFEVLTSEGLYLAKILAHQPLTFKMIERKTIKRELPIEFTVFIPLLKRDNFELCITKAVELGVTRIVPFLSTRTIKRISKAEFVLKKVRYQRLIEEAVEQSNRDVIPLLQDLIDIKEISSFEFDKAYVPYEELSVSSKLLDPGTRFAKNERVAVIIGPEGGFLESEIDLLVEAGFTPISLGKRILRAETAVFMSLGLIAYLAEVSYEL